MFLENLENTFVRTLEKKKKNTVLKAIMPKRKTITVAIPPTQRKSLGYLILDQKLGKNLKR